MKLYTIGDSWTYGDELVNPKKDSWPSVLSKELGCELINDAQCGGPNDWMFRRTIEWISQQKSLDDTIVIVAWSEPNRREENFNPIIYGEKLWKKVMKYFYSDELSHYKSICYMVSLQEFLKSKNVKYLFFQPWCDILSSEKRLQKVRNNKSKFSDWLSNPVPGPFYSKKLGIGDIIKNIDKKYVLGPRVVHHKLDRGHPTKEEHKIISKFIKEKILEVYP
tara:strand:- start:721 stop:1383 length:663 start_codon:yes stop_codon:yes gene_type:complete